jgi:hypothetical protein
MQSRPLNIFRDSFEKILAEHFEQRCHHALIVRSRTRTNVPRVTLDVQAVDDQAIGDDCVARISVKVRDHEEREYAVLNGLLEVAGFFHGFDLPVVDDCVVTDIVFQSANLKRRVDEVNVEGTAVFDIFYVYDT